MYFDVVASVLAYGDCNGVNYGNLSFHSINLFKISNILHTCKSVSVTYEGKLPYGTYAQ